MLGYQLNPNPRYETEVIYDEESAGGRGLSQALGLAGFTNLDVVRNPNLGPTPYTARVEIHQTIGFTNETVPQDRGPLALATSVPVRRLELRAGKFTLPDMLDVNAVLSDSHQQFMNWTIDNNGAWDYAADTRGYTYGADIEYQDRSWGCALCDGVDAHRGQRNHTRLGLAAGARRRMRSLRFAKVCCPAGMARSVCWSTAITRTWATIAKPSIITWKA